MGKANILVVDDDPLVRSFVQESLQKEGLEADQAEDGASALRLLRSEPYDLVVLDFNLPDVEGVAFLKEVKKALGSGADVISIGEDRVDEAVQAIKNGAYYYFAKPLIKDEFVVTLHNCLEKIHLSLENISLKRKADLFDIIKSISLTMDLDKLVTLLMDSAVEITRADLGLLALYEEESAPLRIYALRGVSLRNLGGEFFGIKPNRLQEIIKKGEVSFIEDVSKHEELAPCQTGERSVSSLIILPVISKGKQLGVVIVGKTTGAEKGFQKEDISLLSKLIAETSLAVENALLSRKKEELIIKDDLTKAYNRRFFESYFDEEIRRCKRYSLLLSLIFMDLNDFKRINILYGHFVGSQVLQEVASRIISKVRNVDKVVRYGGDEFCIVLPETGPQEAYLVSKRIREEIESKSYECAQSKYYSLTGSYGIASFPEHGSTKRELVDAADKAMFLAKDPKRESIIIAERSKQ